MPDKLINIVAPDTMYLGAKDAQQVVVLKTMLKDLNFGVKVKILATVREPGGLAMSSRNSYLTSQQRDEANLLFQALRFAKKAIANIRAGNGPAFMEFTTYIFLASFILKNIINIYNSWRNSKTNGNR